MRKVFHISAKQRFFLKTYGYNAELLSIIVCMKEKPFTAESIADFLKNDTLVPVALCIGTDRVIGDALGPVVGELLVSAFNAPFFVYGTLASPVTALNLGAALDFIRRRHPGQKLIAIDSSMGKAQDVGKIRLTDGGIRPGFASGKRLPVTGDLSVTATVAASNESNAINCVKLGFVYKTATEIAQILVRGINLFLKNRLSEAASQNKRLKPEPTAPSRRIAAARCPFPLRYK